MKVKKDTRVTLQLTQEQYESIATRSDTAQMAVGTYVRAVAMRHRVVVVDGMPEIIRELKGIGRNLNRLTVLANMGPVAEVNLGEATAAQNRILERLGSKPILSADFTGIVGGVVELGHALERNQCAAPIKDATTCRSTSTARHGAKRARKRSVWGRLSMITRKKKAYSRPCTKMPARKGCSA